MGQILQKINLWVRRHREITAAAVGLLVVVLFSVSVCGTLSTQASAAMEKSDSGNLRPELICSAQRDYGSGG